MSRTNYDQGKSTIIEVKRMANVLRWLGLAPSENEKNIIELLNESKRARTAKVVGRGTVMIDAKQIRQDPKFKELYKKAATIVIENK